jgi:hypothetical protein
MRHIKNILLSIRDEESKVDLSPQHVIENSRYLACYLLKKHEVLKEYVLENGFSDINQEIEFFSKKTFTTDTLSTRNLIKQSLPFIANDVGTETFHFVVCIKAHTFA